MDTLPIGCYERKEGYRREFGLEGYSYVYHNTGGTRMMFSNLQKPNLVAKCMPARCSRHFKPGWIQNDTEARYLRKLASFNLAPRVHRHLVVRFVNRWNQTDTMDVLVIDRLGKDLKKAVNDDKISFSDYVKACDSALCAIAKMANLDVVVPDPLQCNVSLVYGSTTSALPCDFGAAVPATKKDLHKSFKCFLRGFREVSTTVYGVQHDHRLWADLLHHVSRVDVPLPEEWVMRAQRSVYVWAEGRCNNDTQVQRVQLREAHKVMIQISCCLSCLGLLHNSYKTLSFRKVIASGSF